MKKYAIGLITGALLGISAMMFMGSQNKNLGNITADSITAKRLTLERQDQGAPMLRISGEMGTTLIMGGGMSIDDANGGKIIYLGTNEKGDGLILTYQRDGKIGSALD